MKRIHLVTILTLLSLAQGYAQVGIGTENPEGILHIDGTQNNDFSSSNQKYIDDVIVTKDGKIGIRTKDPQGILHIDRLGNNDESNAKDLSRFDDDFIIYEDGVKMGITPSTNIDDPFLRILNGAEGEGKVLTSDAEGEATWRTVPSQKIINGALNSGRSSIPLKELSDDLSFINDGSAYTGVSISLPPGTWKVRLGLLLTLRNTKGHKMEIIDPEMEVIEPKTASSDDGYIWVSSTLSESNNSNAPTADLVANSLVSNSIDGEIENGEIKRSVISGSFLVRNSSSKEKNYYLHLSRAETEISSTKKKYLTFEDIGQISSGENYIYAKQCSLD